MADKKEPVKKVGVLWNANEVQKQKGLLATGTIEFIVGQPVNVALFKNTKKEPNSNQPDMNLVISRSTKKAETEKDITQSSSYL